MESPPTSDPGVIFFLSIVGLMLLAGVAYGVLLLARWNSTRIRYVTHPRVRSEPLRSEVRRSVPVFAETDNAETDETPEFDAETEAALICLGETQALARLIAEGKLGLTDAVKIGAGAKSGEKYQRRSREIKAEVERLTNKYPLQTSEQKQNREALGLPK